MEIKTIVVEYLIIVKEEDTFCDTDTAFLKFLAVDSSLTISENDNQLTIKLKKGNKLTVSYTLFSGLVPSENERYFKFTISSKEIDKINDLNILTTLLEKIIVKLHPEVSINVLWNDIARKYAVEGYTLINEVENLLRRLIANFMLTKVGYNYPKYHIPNEVGNRDTHLKINYSDYLHQTYFSDLKTILFEGQREFNYRNIGDIQKIVEKHISENKNQILVDDLKGVISKSLWEKHFAKDTSYAKKDLEEDLEKLNTLRNEIAHNRHINRETLGKIQNISKRIIKTLNLEIADLPNKNLTVDEQNFQADTENVRIAIMNPAMYGYLAEKVISEWYKMNFGSHNVILLDEFQHALGIDIQVILHKRRIGVRIKSVSFNRLGQFKNQIVNALKSGKLFPTDLNEFSEYHLVVVLRDFDETAEIPQAYELDNLLTSANPDIKLIVGYINENSQFIKLM